VGSSEQLEKTPSIGSNKTDSSGHSINIAIECAASGNIERFVRCFDDENDPFHDSVASLINTRSSDDSKSALDWASLIGNVAMVSELIKRGADINAVSEKGRLHYFSLIFLSVIFFRLVRVVSITLTCSGRKRILT